MALTVSHSTKDFLSSSFPLLHFSPFLLFCLPLSSSLSLPFFPFFLFSMSFPQKILIEQLLYSKHISYVILDVCDLVREREKKQQHSTSWVKELITGQKDSAMSFSGQHYSKKKNATFSFPWQHSCYLKGFGS